MKKLVLFLLSCGMVLLSLNASADHQKISTVDHHSWYQALGASILSSPYLGIRTQYDGSYLISNTTSVNKDIALLELEQGFDALLRNQNKDTDNSVIELSGSLQGQIFVQDPYVGAKKSDIDLTGAQVDVYARMTSWVKGFLSVNYDNSLPTAVITRSDNARFSLDSGFILIGNFNDSPWYMSLGQLYVPFGQYSTHMISSPLTKALGFTTARALVVGYKHSTVNGLHAAVYGFHGDSKVGANTNLNRRINHWGADVGLRADYSHGSVDLVASYINNVTDALGMQANGGVGFTGFGASGATAVLVHNVPAADARVNVKWYDYFVLAEWLSTVRHFDPANMTFNGEGAQPSAWHTEVGYRWKLCSKPVALALAYDQTHEALALNIAKQQYGMSLSAIIWRETLLKFEYRHEHNYGNAATATGAGVAFVPAANTLGRSRNTLSTQLTVYF